MEKRRIGTRFLDRDVTAEDLDKPLVQKIQDTCALMWLQINFIRKNLLYSIKKIKKVLTI